ncbi:hypothetical protein F2Q68_00013510 [Brassica cretica]|uniref:Uncharacterized protein n=1 Tax=Brassica cretica TaxID=69181 RepID=A0A8S9HEG7_BRACR|nr:hypothetical protein F2Q68_00013510 [Brassica cretica]
MMLSSAAARLIVANGAIRIKGLRFQGRRQKSTRGKSPAGSPAKNSSTLKRRRTGPAPSRQVAFFCVSFVITVSSV